MKLTLNPPDQASGLRKLSAAAHVAEVADRYRMRQATAHELDAAIDAWRETEHKSDAVIVLLRNLLDEMEFRYNESRYSTTRWMGEYLDALRSVLAAFDAAGD